METPRALALGFLFALGCARAHAPHGLSDSGPSEPPWRVQRPARPPGVLALATLPRPTQSAQSLGRAMGTRIPVELSLALALGIEVSVLSALDPTRPMTFTLTGDLDALRWTVAFTPGSAARARAALSPRYRFTTVENLGERLDPRGESESTGSSERRPCALVVVPSEITSRVVCAINSETLSSTGRWTAFESARSVDFPEDLRVNFEGDALRGAVLPALVQKLRAMREELGAAASTARREHPRPPDVGDPEAAVALLGDLSRELERAGEECSRGELRVELTRLAAVANISMVFQANGRSSVVTDAVSRVGAAPGHPLASRLPPDAFWMSASRSAAAPRVEALRRVIEAQLQVLGGRVLTEAAQRDLDALVANTGDESAVAISRDAPEGLEITVMFSQTEGGEGARAVLSRIARSAWLRGARLGSPLRVTPGARGAVLLQLPARGSRTAEVSLALGVRAGALVLVLGRRAMASLDAVELRPADGSPSLMLGAEPRSLGGGVYFGRRESPGEPLRWGYGATRDGNELRVEARVHMPNAALPLLRGFLSP